MLKFDTQLFSQYNHTIKSDLPSNAVGTVVLIEKGGKEGITCPDPERTVLSGLGAGDGLKHPY